MRTRLLLAGMLVAALGLAGLSRGPRAGASTSRAAGRSRSRRRRHRVAAGRAGGRRPRQGARGAGRGDGGRGAADRPLPPARGAARGAAAPAAGGEAAGSENPMSAAARSGGSRRRATCGSRPRPTGAGRPRGLRHGPGGDGADRAGPEADHAATHHRGAGQPRVLVAAAHGGGARRAAGVHERQPADHGGHARLLLPGRRRAARPPRARRPRVRPQAPGRAAAGAGRGSKVDRVEVFGNVEIRTETEVVRGDRGVYSPARAWRACSATCASRAARTSSTGRKRS